MKVYGLIGYPLTHSFSNKYFTEKFQREGIQDCIHKVFSFENIDSIKEVLNSNPELLGFNVTIPHKQHIIPYLSWQDEVVKTCGACNCVKISGGKLYGYNTDVTGFEYSLKPLLKPHHTKALVLGTGGAAKAVAYVLNKLAVDYKFVSRKKSHEAFSYDELNQDIIEEYCLIINCTPLGMFPKVVEAPQIPYGSLSAKHLLFDLIYNPGKTLFLQKGEERGAAIKNGHEMLVKQAEESWRIWNS
jgi:shikimate dehydrogenase